MLLIKKLRKLFLNHRCQFWSLFLLIILIRFLPFFQGKTLIFGDNYSLMMPGKIFTAQWLKQGVLPLWNPYIFSGTPWVADIGQSVLYPSTLLFVLFPPSTALNLTIILHLLVAYIGMYLLAKHWFKNHSWALIAAVLWMLSTQVMSLINNLATLQSIVWLPLIIYFGLRLVKETRYRIWFSVAVAVQFLGGYPQHVLYSILTAVLFSGYLSWRKTSLITWLKAWFFTATLTLSISAIAWLPFVEMLQNSTRITQSAGQAVVGSLQPAMLIQFFLPQFFDNPAAGVRWGAAWNGQLNVGIFITWLGWLAVLLSLLAARGKDKRANWFFGAITILAIAFSFGQFLPGFDIVQRLLPLFRITRYPSMMLIVANMMLIFWSINSLRKLQSQTMIRWLKNSIYTASLVVLTVGLIGWFIAANTFERAWTLADRFASSSLSQSPFHTLERDRLILLEISKITVFHAIFFIASFYIVTVKKGKQWLWVLAVLVAGDMLVATNRDQFFFAPRNAYDINSNVLKQLFNQPNLATEFQARWLTRNLNSPYTDYSSYWDAISIREPFSDSFVNTPELQNFDHSARLRIGLTPNWNMAYNVPMLNGYATLLPRDYAEIWQQSDESRINFIDYVDPADPLLDAWSVKYYLVDRWFKVEEDLSAWPVVGEYDRWQILERSTVLPRIRFEDGAAPDLIGLQEDPNTLTLGLDNSDSHSHLIIADRYDQDWRASINGFNAPIENFNGMRQIALEPGLNTMRLWYWPKALIAGAWVTILSTIAASSYLWLYKRKNHD